MSSQTILTKKSRENLNIKIKKSLRKNQLMPETQKSKKMMRTISIKMMMKKMKMNLLGKQALCSLEYLYLFDAFLFFVHLLILLLYSKKQQSLLLFNFNFPQILSFYSHVLLLIFDSKIFPLNQIFFFLETWIRRILPYSSIAM